MQKNFEEYPKYLFHEGTNIEADKLFCPKKAVIDGKKGWIFRVWAPNARDVSLVGDFNGWEVGATPMKKDDGGIWEVFVEGLKVYDAYKYAVTSKKGKTVLKADPYGLHFETTPQTASKLYDLSGYKWKDAAWLKSREEKNIYESPMNIYEVHLGSWKRHDDGNVYTVIIDDNVPAKAVGGSGANKDLIQYTTYLLGTGAIRAAQGRVDRPSEVDRDPKTNGGQDTLYTRIRETIHPNGFTFTIPSSGWTQSPTDAQLSASANWSVMYDPKAIPLARLITNG